MKKTAYFISFLLLVCVGILTAQNDYKIKVFQKNGNTSEYLVSETKQIDCLSDALSDKISINPKEGSKIDISTVDIDSITYSLIPDTIRLLAIGNSFSEDAIEQELYPLAKAAGVELIIGNMYIGGCDLNKHWTQASTDAASYSYRKIVNGIKTTTASTKLSTALKDENWDYISFQEGAGHHGFTDYIDPYLTNLINYCREYSKNKDFKVIYHACWAAQTGCTSEKFSYYDFDQAKMYKMIVEATKSIMASHKIDLLMNSMDAIQNGRTSYLGDTFNRDGWHLNKTYGRYTASCLWLEKLTGKNPVGNTYHPASISASVAEVCQTAAHLAVANPYTISDISYFEKQNDDINDSTRVLAQWYFTPSRAVSDGAVQTWAHQNKVGTYTYSNKPGERGYYLATGKGSGKLSYVQIDKTAWTDASGDERAGLSILDASNGGQPVMCGQMAGDYWLFETTGDYEFEEGSVLRMFYTTTPSNYGAKYWLVEYMDGTEWKPAMPTKQTFISASDETIRYNVELTAGEKKDIDFKVTLENRTKEFKVRIKCCSEYQVNNKWFNHPRRQSVQRIAGTPEDLNLPIMEEFLK